MLPVSLPTSPNPLLLVVLSGLARNLPHFFPCSFRLLFPFSPANEKRLTGSFPQTGVNVDIKDYGGVQGVDYMDPGRTIGLWNDTIAVLTSLGYEIGKYFPLLPPPPQQMVTNRLNGNRQEYQSRTV